jgi:hypothetical protein
METVLYDVMDEDSKQELKAKVTADNRGIYISLDGYEDGCGNPETILVELCEGEARVVVWADKEQEDPSHIISMEGVKLTKTD